MSDDLAQLSDEAQSLGAAEGRRRILLALGLVALLFAPVAFFLLVAAVFDVRIAPEDVAPAAQAEVAEGVGFLFGGRLVLLSDEARLTVSVKGFEAHEETVLSTQPRVLDVVLRPLPGLVHLRTTAAEPVEILVDGTLLAEAAEASVELPAGRHTVSLRGPLIRPLTETIDVVGRGQAQQIVLQPERAASYLSLATEPATARVVVDGSALEAPVVQAAIGVGEHELVISADGYATRAVRFRTTLDESVDLGLVRLAKDPLHLSIRSTPPGAAVLLDGSFLDSTPAVLQLAAGVAHSLQVTKPNYASASLAVQGRPGERIERAIRLDKLTARVAIVANVEAEVSVDGVPQGRTPLDIDVDDNARIDVSRPGHVSQSRTVRVADGASQTLRFQLLTPAEIADREASEALAATSNLTLAKFPAIEFELATALPDWREAGEREERRQQRRTARITRPFYLSTTEVTQADYAAFQGKSAAPGRYPVVNVSWADAAGFCNWLSAESGLPPAYRFAPNGRYQDMDPQATGYRLPTELEWLAAYSAGAARSAGTARRASTYPWGDSPKVPRAYGNFAGREAQGLGRTLAGYVDDHAELAPVAAYLANANGIHDMAGNVAEWVHDYYARLPQGAELTDYLGPERGHDHVVRGGHYATSQAAELSVSHRAFGNGPQPRVGFRVARWVY